MESKCSKGLQESESQPVTENRSSSEVFVKHLEDASKLVKTWPVWKQELLGGSASG